MSTITEYIYTSGTQSFLGATQNYKLISGEINLYKNFLPQAWEFSNDNAVSAFIHPENVFEDPNGKMLRKILYQKLKYHFQFTNELNLFEDVYHHAVFSLNVYTNEEDTDFYCIANLFDIQTVDQCFDSSIQSDVVEVGIKDSKGNWNTQGSPERLIHISIDELRLFSNLYDGSDEWESARLPRIQAKAIISVLSKFNEFPEKINNTSFKIAASMMWHETYAQDDGIITRKEHFPCGTDEMVYSGPLIGIANPVYKGCRSKCYRNSDYDPIDLTSIDCGYLQRCMYSPIATLETILNSMVKTPWENNYYFGFKLAARAMLNPKNERSLISCIIPKKSTHINGIISIESNEIVSLVSMASTFSSIPFDYFVRATGMNNLRITTIDKLPYIYDKRIVARFLLLNCLNIHYKELWQECFNEYLSEETWSKSDPRLDNKRFSRLTSKWTWNTPLRTDYERRQALVEIDVLTAMALGMTLEQLKTIYRIQFPVLQQYEADTWYDANGRIVFTTNRSLVGVGFDRPTWEHNVKGAPAGKVFTREIEDDTQPGGPVKRTVEYVAPFDKCDREQDYETAWKFFEEKYGKITE